MHTFMYVCMSCVHLCTYAPRPAVSLTCILHYIPSNATCTNLIDDSNNRKAADLQPFPSLHVPYPNQHGA